MGLAHTFGLGGRSSGTIVSYDDVELVDDRDVVAIRREMEDRFKPAQSVAAQ